MKTIQLIPVGNAPSALLKDLDSPLQAQLGVATALGKVTLAEPTYAYNKDRSQYHSNAIMRRLVPLVESVLGVLALTEVDLFVPDSPFIFGEADRESHVALLSVARLRTGPDPEPLKR